MTTGYAKIALTGDYGISWLLTRLAGTARARELMFLSEKLDARRCEMLGLVNRVVPDEQLASAAVDSVFRRQHEPGNEMFFSDGIALGRMYNSGRAVGLSRWSMHCSSLVELAT